VSGVRNQWVAFSDSLRVALLRKGACGKTAGGTWAVFGVWKLSGRTIGIPKYESPPF
jgi:hypothetical protein